MKITQYMATLAIASLCMISGCSGPAEETETAAPQETATAQRTPAPTDTTSAQPATAPQQAATPQKTTGFHLTTDAFAHEGMIPVQYTCDSANESPLLKWSNAPKGTRSFALICDDPDAPTGTFVHWVLFNIPPDTRGLPAGLPQSDTLAGGMRQGSNDFRELGYGGPCPPRGTTHRYFFKLYALDTSFERIPGASKRHLEEAMQGHVLAQTELVGRYTRASD